jgi:hypothetical protein
LRESEREKIEFHEQKWNGKVVALEMKNKDCSMQKWNINVQVKRKYKRNVIHIN